LAKIRFARAPIAPSQAEQYLTAASSTDGPCCKS